MVINPHEIRSFKIRRQHISEEFEEQQFWDGVVYGADGSIIDDGDDVIDVDTDGDDG